MKKLRGLTYYFAFYVVCAMAATSTWLCLNFAGIWHVFPLPFGDLWRPIECLAYGYFALLSWLTAVLMMLKPAPKSGPDNTQKEKEPGGPISKASNR